MGGWMGGLIIINSFNICVSHVNFFTSKIDEQGEGSEKCFWGLIFVT